MLTDIDGACRESGMQCSQALGMKMEPLAKGHSNDVSHSCEVTLCLFCLFVFSSSLSSFLGGGCVKMVLFIFAIACKINLCQNWILSFLFC